jgi:hypothetical protein
MKTFVALDSSQKLNQVLYESTVDFVEQTIMRKLSNAAGNRLNVSGYQGVMEKIGGVNASPGLWGEAPSGPTSGVRPATEQRPDRPLDVTVHNDADVGRVALQESIRTGDFSTQTITMADGTLRRQPMRRDVVIRGAIGYARMLQNRGYDWKTHKTEPPEGTPGPARLSISESLHAEIGKALGEKGEPATQKPAVMGQDELPLDDPTWKPPAPKEPIPPAAQHDAGNLDAYKTNESFQKHFSHLDDAGQRAKWREVHEEYTTGGEWRHPDAPPKKGHEQGELQFPDLKLREELAQWEATRRNNEFALLPENKDAQLRVVPLGPKPTSPAEDPLAVDSDDFGGMMEEKELEFGKLSEESSEARKLWEKDKLPENPGPDDNVLGLSYVGKTITVRGEKFTVLEAGEKGMLVKDAEGNEYYISNNELPKEVIIDGRPAYRVSTPFYDPEGARARI